MARAQQESTKRPPPLKFESSLNDWVKKQVPTALSVGKDGFKNGEQLRTFLLSPVGKTFSTALMFEVATQKSKSDTIMAEAIEQYVLNEIIRGALLRAYLRREEATADRIKKYAEELNHKILDELQSTTTANSQKGSTDPEQRYAPESPTLAALEKIQQNIIEREQLEYQLANTQRQKALMLVKHEQFVQAMAIFDTEDGHLEGLEIFAIKDLHGRQEFYASDLEKIKKIKGKMREGENDPMLDMGERQGNLKLTALIDLIQVQHGEKFYADENGNRVPNIKKAKLLLSEGQQVVIHNDEAYLLQPGQKFNPDDENLKAEAKQRYVEARQHMRQFKLLTAILRREIEMDKGALDLAILIEDLAHHSTPKGPQGVIQLDDNLVRFKDQQNTLNLELGQLNDMLDVELGRKYYADAQGNEVAYGEKAEFIVDRDKKLVDVNGQMYAINPEKQEILEHGGKHYLVKKGQTWEDLLKDPDDKAILKAESAFNRLKNDTAMSVKTLVKHNNKLEVEFMDSEVDRYKGKLDENVRQGNSLMASLTPTPRPTPMPTTPTPSSMNNKPQPPRGIDQTQSFRYAVRGNTEEQRELTPEVLKNCRPLLLREDQPEYDSLVKNAMLGKSISETEHKAIMTFLQKRDIPDPWAVKPSQTPFDGLHG